MMVAVEGGAVSTGTSRAYKRWLPRIEADELPKSLIYEFCQAIAPRQYPSRGAARIGGRTTNIFDYQAKDLCERLQERMTNGDGGPKVNARQYRQGVDWLTKYAVKIGLPAHWQTSPGRVDYENGIEYFRWSDWWEEYNNSGYASTIRPEYTIYFKNGEKLWYRPSPWCKDCEWCWA